MGLHSEEGADVIRRVNASGRRECKAPGFSPRVDYLQSTAYPRLGAAFCRETICVCILSHPSLGACPLADYPGSPSKFIL